MALHLLVGRPAVVLPLQPGEDPHVEGLVQPGPALAGDSHLEAAVRGPALPHSAGPGLAALAGVAPPAPHGPGDDAPPPDLLAGPAGLGTRGPAGPEASHTVTGTGGGLAGSPLLHLLAGSPGSSLSPPPSHLLTHATAGRTSTPARVGGVLTPNSLLLLVLLLHLLHLLLLVSDTGDLHPSLPPALPRLRSVEATPVPVTARGEILRLADTPAQAARVPEQHSVLLSGTKWKMLGNSWSQGTFSQLFFNLYLFF